MLRPIPPNLAERKLIDLANYVPSSNLRGASHNHFFTQPSVASLYRRILIKHKSRTLFWRILEDDKQNERENQGNDSKKYLRIILLKCSEICPAELFASKALLILMTFISEFMHAISLGRLFHSLIIQIKCIHGSLTCSNSRFTVHPFKHVWFHVADITFRC